ncbi:MAG: ABC transporter permease [Candidatus Rokubacteria bacterium]|nr:ABC transporter permease [Candidatus Rokubacteria bacterium]
MSRSALRAFRHVTFTAGVVVSLLLVATALLSLAWTPRDPLAMSIATRLQGPSLAHPFGTDQYGHDILSRVMAGARTSIAVGVIAVGLGLVAGMALGIASGWIGGWLDETLMRLIDAVQGFPAILSALLLTAVFGPGIVISMVAIGIAFVPVFARLTRASFLELRAREFVLAARALGAADRRLILRHILPNTLAPVIVQATTSFPVAILAEAALAYLGLGTQPPNPSWGLMLKEAQNFLSLSPSFALFPGGAIGLSVLGLNLLGDGLRDVLDPKTA